MQTQEQFFLAHQDADGNLTDAQTMEMMFLPVEADTPTMPASAPASGESSAPAAPAAPADPAAPPVAATPPATPAADAQPVLLAKDGVHTIPFSELERARTDLQSKTTELAAMQAQLEAITRQPAGPAAAAAPAAPANPDASSVFDLDLGEMTEADLKEGLRKGIEAGVAAQTAALVKRIDQLTSALAPLQEQAQVSEDDLHFVPIRLAHPDVESVVPSAEFAKWRDAQPSYVRAGIVATIEGGSSQEVIECLNSYKTAVGLKSVVSPSPAAGGALKAPVADAATAAAAAEAIRKAQVAVPTSLSEIPSGSMQAADPTQAVFELSDTAQMNMFMGKSPDEIAALMNKLL